MIRLAPYHPRDAEESVYDLSRTLRGTRMRLRLEYYPRRAGWYLTLWVADVEVLSGRRLVADAPLLWRHRLAIPHTVDAGRQMPGRLVLVALAGDGSECDQSGLGWTHVLYWGDATDQGVAAQRVVTVS